MGNSDLSAGDIGSTTVDTSTVGTDTSAGGVNAYNSTQDYRTQSGWDPMLAGTGSTLAAEFESFYSSSAYDPQADYSSISYNTIRASLGGESQNLTDYEIRLTIEKNILQGSIDGLNTQISTLTGERDAAQSGWDMCVIELQDCEDEKLTMISQSESDSAVSAAIAQATTDARVGYVTEGSRDSAIAAAEAAKDLIIDNLNTDFFSLNDALGIATNSGQASRVSAIAAVFGDLQTAEDNFNTLDEELAQAYTDVNALFDDAEVTEDNQFFEQWSTMTAEQAQIIASTQENALAIVNADLTRESIDLTSDAISTLSTTLSPLATLGGEMQTGFSALGVGFSNLGSGMHQMGMAQMQGMQQMGLSMGAMGLSMGAGFQSGLTSMGGKMQQGLSSLGSGFSTGMGKLGSSFEVGFTGFGSQLGSLSVALQNILSKKQSENEKLLTDEIASMTSEIRRRDKKNNKLFEQLLGNVWQRNIDYVKNNQWGPPSGPSGGDPMLMSGNATGQFQLPEFVDPELVLAAHDPALETYASSVLASLNLREPEVDKEISKFVYNRYTNDEHISYTESSTDLSNSLHFESIDEVAQASRSMYDGDVPPKYIQIKFSYNRPDNFYNTAWGQSEFTTDGRQDIEQNGTIYKSFIPVSHIGQIKQNFLDASNKDRFTKINTEGALSSAHYESTELTDTGLDNKIYNYLRKASEFYTTIESELGLKQESEREMIENFKDRARLYDQTISGNSSTNKLLTDFVANAGRILGVYDPSSASSYDSISNKIKYQSHTMGFNNACLTHLAWSSSRNKSNLFCEEIAQYIGPAEQLLTKASGVNFIADSSPSTWEVYIAKSYVWANALSFQVQGSDSNVIPMAEYDINPPAMHHLGYIIEKYELPSARSASVIRHPHKFIDANRNSFLDLDIAYSREYIYKIRTLCLAEFDFVRNVPGNPDAAQMFRAGFLVVSKGGNVKIKCVESVPPEPPILLKFRYDATLERMKISWPFPKNKQNDIAGFQIFKRSSFAEGFTLIGEIDFNRSIYAGIHEFPRFGRAPASERYVTNNPLTSFDDDEFRDNSIEIYAVTAYDVHGMTSKFSSQYFVKYNRLHNKTEAKLISRRGAPLPYPNYYLKKEVFKDCLKVSGMNRMSVFFEPEYSEIFATQIDYSTTSPTSMNDEYPVNLISKSDVNKPSDVSYKINLINTDLQTSRNIDIRIVDKSTPNVVVNTADLNDINFSFNFIEGS